MESIVYFLVGIIVLGFGIGGVLLVGLSVDYIMLILGGMAILSRGIFVLLQEEEIT